ncbi:hypothetical protein [Streptococcus dysgalactiae]|uniref:hypothetical protein n=1 Tax=Streptococcus dysgalactiae TaxID=1334 RepID=UPI001C9D9091|nr:hypothetical protein [Streptococcus dysgalactiae]MDY4001971.1 hypothetical protein [Streptococcus orisratti]QZT27502.1 hypothetical protein K6973_01715 [Streptococcus dysgalactiae]
MAIPLIISTYCSAGCNHCPFNKAGTKIKNPEINDKEIYIITGGEPLEDLTHLRNVVKQLQSKNAYFRLATGGHIRIASIHNILSNTSNYLGINIGTDILLRNDSTDLQKIWLKNWGLYGKLSNTWLTITLSYDIELPTIEKLITETKPRKVLLNEIEDGFKDYIKYFHLLKTKFPLIIFIEGYRNET